MTTKMTRQNKTIDVKSRDALVAEAVARIRKLEARIYNLSEDLKDTKKKREEEYASIRSLFPEDGTMPLFEKAEDGGDGGD